MFIVYLCNVRERERNMKNNYRKKDVSQKDGRRGKCLFEFIIMNPHCITNEGKKGKLCGRKREKGWENLHK